jgi:hypothetical protein
LVQQLQKQLLDEKWAQKQQCGAQLLEQFQI